MSRRNLYRREEWSIYINQVKSRDGFSCQSCGRDSSEVILHVHHTRYFPNTKPWDYALSDCITLCAGCHAVEHEIIEPKKGWRLLSINDLGDLSGCCEREGCHNSIRYEMYSYHPKGGYKILGSKCVEYLTQEDNYLCQDVMKQYRRIGNFMRDSYWEYGRTKNGKLYRFTKFKHHQIRIYGYEGESRHSFQLALKVAGEKWHDFQEIVNVKGFSFEIVKEMAYVALIGNLAQYESEKEILRDIYKGLKASQT